MAKSDNGDSFASDQVARATLLHTAAVGIRSLLRPSSTMATSSTGTKQPNLQFYYSQSMMVFKNCHVFL